MRGSLYIANKNSPTVQNRPPLSEGQKGLLMFAYLRLQTPGLLIFDEPTNHINFRHIPAIIDAIKNYEGPVIVVLCFSCHSRGGGNPGLYKT